MLVIDKVPILKQSHTSIQPTPVHIILSLQMGVSTRRRCVLVPPKGARAHTRACMCERLCVRVQKLFYHLVRFPLNREIDQMCMSLCAHWLQNKTSTLISYLIRYSYTYGKNHHQQQQHQHQQLHRDALSLSIRIFQHLITSLIMIKIKSNRNGS